jgi:hypothetical protein
MYSLDKDISRSADNIEHLMDFLRRNPSIKYLFVSQPDIAPEVMCLLMRSLAGNKTLTRLHLLVRNSVGARELVGNTTLQVLELVRDWDWDWDWKPYSRRKENEFMGWVDAINNMTHVETLVMNDILINIGTAGLLVKNKTLRHLKLTRAIPATVLTVLAKNRSITHLELTWFDDCNCNCNCNVSRLEALEDNIVLEILTLRNIRWSDVRVLAKNKNLLALNIDRIGGIQYSSSVKDDAVNELLSNKTLMRLTIEVGCSQAQQELMDTLAKQNKGLQIKYAKGCKKLLSDSFPRVLVEIMFGYVFSPQRCALMGIGGRPEGKQPAQLLGVAQEKLGAAAQEETQAQAQAQAQIPIIVVRPLPEQSSQRPRFFYNQNAIEPKELKYKTGGLIVLTVGSTVGIFYLGIAGTAAICIPIVLCVASMYYGFSLYQNHSERGALERPGMASP